MDPSESDKLAKALERFRQSPDFPIILAELKLIRDGQIRDLAEKGVSDSELRQRVAVVTTYDAVIDLFSG